MAVTDNDKIRDFWHQWKQRTPDERREWLQKHQGKVKYIRDLRWDELPWRINKPRVVDLPKPLLPEVFWWNWSDRKEVLK